MFNRLFAKQRSSVVFPSRPCEWGDITGIGFLNNFNKQLAMFWPDIAVYEIPHGYADSCEGWVFNRKKSLIKECNWFGCNMKNANIQKPTTVNHLPGNVLTITSNWSSRNYGHFLLDSIGRLAIIESSECSLASFDNIICPKPNIKNFEKILAAVGIDESKCIFNESGTVYRADKLYATSFPGSKRNYPDWLCVFLKKKLCNIPPKNLGRRLFVQRSAGARRNITNSESVAQFFVEHGFEIFDPLTAENPIEDFSEASFIAGPHGSGLTDLVFCQKGTKVLEIFPSDHIHPYYFTLARSSGLQYFYVVGPSEQIRPDCSYGPSPFDFYVPIESLEVVFKLIDTR